jgi:hypothetical protein
MSFSGYLSNEDGGADVNFNKNPARFPDPWAKIAGVGCAGTNSGIDASKSVFVEPPYVGIGGANKRRLKRHYRNKKYTGGFSGYGFSDPNNNPIQIASPYSLYPVINTYENSGNFKAPHFPQQFMDGKPFSSQFTGDRYKGGRKTMRRNKNKKMVQYGCSKKGRTCKGGDNYSMRLARRGGARRSMRRSRSKRRSMKRSKTMRGGMSDYTEGRNASQDQPYANQAISFGQGLDTTLSPELSGLASPPPLLPYNTCGKYRN